MLRFEEWPYEVELPLGAEVADRDRRVDLERSLDALAGLLDRDPAGLRAGCLPVVRELLVDGFLTAGG